jgi:hypothetical protein
MKKLEKLLTQGLLAFVLISIGFALGKHSITPALPAVEPSPSEGKHVAVYYLHSTFRCVTCNTIEKMTRELLETSYRNETADDRIRWHEVDFQENEALAKKFKVLASCVVVAEVEDGEITAFKRLDEVWTLMKDPPAFDQYISDAIDSYLGESKGGA